MNEATYTRRETRIDHILGPLDIDGFHVCVVGFETIESRHVKYDVIPLNRSRDGRGVAQIDSFSRDFDATLGELARNVSSHESARACDVCLHERNQYDARAAR
jgi:hypothetical protein